MSSTSLRSGLPRIDTPDWFERAGEVIQSIGTQFFHRELIKLLEASIRSDAVWIIRYSGEALPDVVYTYNVPAEAEKVYVEQCAGVDPFSMRWRRTRDSGVFTLQTLPDDSVEYLVYKKIFLQAAGMEDELGVFFPVTAHNCFAFFLEREKGHFTKAEVERARLMFPALESFHRAHLGWLFNELRHTNTPEVTGLINRPTLIRDRTRQQVYANDGWNEVIARHPEIAADVEALSSGAAGQADYEDFVLKAELLGADFPLAPGGRMYVIERHASAYGEERFESLSHVFRIFTPRERDILDLVMQGRNSAEISDRLGIGVGTVKNCKMRIYRKAEVETERALVAKFMPLYEPQAPGRGSAVPKNWAVAQIVPVDLAPESAGR
ncbi:helix-turn-helix transcriptional regulator [Chelatococcus sambhunathii]|uniref:Helix-turn-helix transcriptional regulator n=1 Tax=Chelatococcus sambhunathii TaxID=363953 RepID=A0ABU1DDV4_9HYPH|nr:LuxR C-terminal-related transcriptional regulator [Chelatococcus sambhunathii]MDR4306223.1 helix-turn-helix transcriptional regulator [Chelatococcus sambhunathii]